MHVDDPAGMQPVDPFFNGFVHCCHSVAAVYLSRHNGAKTDDRRGLTCLHQSYGGQAADVTDVRLLARSSLHVPKPIGAIRIRSEIFTPEFSEKMSRKCRTTIID